MIPTALTQTACTWTTDELKKKHIGDRYMDLETGYCYKWYGTIWVRVEISHKIFAL